MVGVENKCNQFCLSLKMLSTCHFIFDSYIMIFSSTLIALWLAYPVQHELQTSLGMANQTHAVVDATRTEPPLGDFKAPPLPKQHVGGRYPHVLKHHLSMATCMGTKCWCRDLE